MKVICIEANFPNRLMLPLVEGQVYDVYQSPALSDHWAIPSLPFKDGVDGNYHKKYFVPMSTIDEMELLEQRQTELV